MTDLETKLIFFIAGQFIVLLGTGIKAYINLNGRMIRVETQFESFTNFIGKKSAKMMHSPDNHHGMDDLLDKYLKHDDLPLEDWIILSGLCDKTIENPATEMEEFLALHFGALCAHKIRCHIPKRLLKTL